MLEPVDRVRSRAGHLQTYSNNAVFHFVIDELLLPESGAEYS